MSTILDCFFITMQNSVFFVFVFRNTGLVFGVLAALVWDHPVTLLGKLQPTSEAALARLQSTFCWFNVSLPEALSFQGCFWLFGVIFSLCILHWWALQCVCEQAFRLGDRVSVSSHGPGATEESHKVSGHSHS